MGPGFRRDANYMGRVRRKGSSIAGDGGADAVAAEIDDRLVEALQRAVMADADDRRVPIGFAHQPVERGPSPPGGPRGCPRQGTRSPAAPARSARNRAVAARRRTGATPNSP